VIKFDIPENYKYDLIAIPTSTVSFNIPDFINLQNGYWAIKHFPIKMLEHWKEWLGTIRIEKFEKSRLFIVVIRKSNATEFLDKENYKLCQDIHRLYFGLLISSPSIGYDGCIRITGSTKEGETNVRQYNIYNKTFKIIGDPYKKINEYHILEAKIIANRLASIENENNYKRIWRIIRAFNAGLESEDPADRIHQFVRCVEGFILPEIGKTRKNYINRTKLFIGNNWENLMGLLFDIRSSFEHLHDPMNPIDESKERDRQFVLHNGAFVSEYIARYCIKRLFLRKQLWQHFESDKAIKDFWKFSLKDKKKHWGIQLDLQSIENDYNVNVFEYHAKRANLF